MHTTSDGSSVRTLVRPRLMKHLDGVRLARLSVISAPRGWGKTTLILDWAATTDAIVSRTSWTEQRRSLSSLTEHVAHRAAQYPIDPGHPVVLVVDDLLGTDVDPAIEAVVLAAPPWFHVLLSTRSAPAINFARAELFASVRLDAGDLRFRVDEIARLFRVSFGRPMSAHDAEAVSADTSGWAAALTLFHEATRRDSESLRSARLHAHDTAPYVDYLETQVLADLSAGDRESLIDCGGLARMTVRRCQELTGRGDVAQLISTVVDLGLAEPSPGEGAFRLIPVISHHLEARARPDERRTALARAASLLEAEGSTSEAVGALAAAQVWDRVLWLLDSFGAEAIQEGSCGWTEQAPAALKESDAFSAARARFLADEGRWEESLAMIAHVETADVPSPVGMAALEIRSQLHRIATTANGPSNQPGTQSPGRALSLLFRGDLIAAIPALKRCVETRNSTASARLVSRLALLVVEGGPGNAALVESLAQVYRDAERSNLRAIARVAHATLVIASGSPDSARARQSIVDTCDAIGDEWGAAAIVSISAMIALRRGEADSDVFESLVTRFRRLGAGSLEAWAQSAKALADVVAHREEAATSTLTAVAVAQRSGSGGALAIAYGALSLDRSQPVAQARDLSVLARQTARDAGMLGRPWTWFGEVEGLPASRRTPVRVRQTTGAVVQCFGGFSFTLNGVRLDLANVRPQARTVLRMLALHAGNPVHRDLMASVLWGELGTSSALHSLHVSVSSLRAVLGRAPSGGTDGLLVRQGETYLLGIDPASDLVSFDRAMGEASEARSRQDAPATAEALRRSVELYVGDVLPEDGAAEWVVGARERYRLHAAEAACSLAQLELQLGNREAAVFAGERSVEIDPWRDESWRTVIDVHYRVGDPVAAARAKNNYARIMASLELPV
jgi:DNA-binding SARP family transcriptional activator